MASAEFLTTEGDILSSPIFDSRKGEAAKTRGLLIEKKIEFLESLACKVSNRRSCRWLNDRLLIELVPRLNAEEIRGLFAPPPWGDNTPQSPFCTTDMGECDLYRNIDMDKERCIQEFIRDSGDGEILDLHVQDPFYRLLLHGVSEFYDLVSVTVTRSEGEKLRKITRIKKKKSGSQQIPPNVTLTGFLKTAKDGAV
ncbi:hypothetical protein QJS10_CPA05g00895 [Acorus calamus]|uniref:R3H-associated N-terminal domain-containing protein n=1 Tax=Acorus calamus TaxID=4465 RepID=A0AAV9ET10_ACOCL|nr:hypothetical protein QJS10_CPA05g00895 [Acorus calamus]